MSLFNKRGPLPNLAHQMKQWTPYSGRACQIKKRVFVWVYFCMQRPPKRGPAPSKGPANVARLAASHRAENDVGFFRLTA